MFYTLIRLSDAMFNAFASNLQIRKFDDRSRQIRDYALWIHLFFAEQALLKYYEHNVWLCGSKSKQNTVSQHVSRGLLCQWVVFILSAKQVAFINSKYDWMGWSQKFVQKWLQWQPEPLNRNESGRFGALKSDSTRHFFRGACTGSGHYGFHSFPVVDWFCLFI